MPLGLAMLCGAVSASADDRQPAAPLDTVTVIANKQPRPAREVATHVSIIEAERFGRWHASDIKELVRYEPAISVGSDPNRFGADGFAIRGIGGNRVAIELDGVPIPDGFAIGSYSNAGRSQIEPELLSRIEILRGPASTLYGSDAIGGVVALVTRDPADLLLGGNLAASLRTGYHGSDDSWSATGRLAAGGPDTRGLLSLTRREGHEVDAAGARANPVDYDSISGFGKFVLDTGDAGSFSIVAELRQEDRYTQVDSFVHLPGRFASTTALSGDDRGERERVSIEHVLPDIGWLADGRWRAWWQRSQSEQLTDEWRTGSERAPAPTRIERSFDYRQSNLGAELTLASTIDAGRLTHRLVYGAEFIVNRTEEQRDGRLTNLDDGTVTDTILGETFPLRDFPVTDTLEAGLYIHDEIAVGGRWSLIPGLRLEYYRLDPREDATYREDNPSGSVTGLSETSLTPKLGWLYRASDAWTLYGQYSRGFRSPPFDDVNVGLEIPLFNIRAIPNPQLKPETSDGIELGVRYGAGRLSGELSVYYNDYRDFIESKVNLGPDPETGVLIFQSRNVAEARIYGAEASLRYDFSLAGLDGFGLQAALAWARGDDRSRDVPLNSVEPAQAVVGLAYDAAGERWGLELISTLTERKDRLDSGATDLFAAPGYTTLDLLGYWRVTRRARLELALFNLTDRRYWEWSDVQGRPAEDPLLPWYARPGFNASLSLSIDL